MPECEFTECKSGQPAALHVNENIGDLAYRTGICGKCAEITGLTEHGDIPQDAAAVNKKLRKAYSSVKAADETASPENSSGAK